MTVIHSPDVTDKFTTQRIRRAAKALVADGTYPSSQLDDLIQDMSLALLEQARKNFDPERARWSTFVTTVLRLVVVSLRRKQATEQSQAEGDVGSLNVLIHDEDGHQSELGPTISEEEHRTGLGAGFVSHTDQVELALDVQAVVDGLPEELREICELLKTHSLAEISRRLDMPMSTLKRRVAQLRERFQAAGLDDAA